MKIFKDFDTFLPALASKRFLLSNARFLALPLKERFFLLKPSKLICNDHRSNALKYIRYLVLIGPDNAPSL